VNPALSLRNPLEVLDDIGHISLCSIDAGSLKSFVEYSSCRADKGLALKILIVTGLFSYQQYASGTAAFTKNGLGGIFEKRAPLTASGRFSQRLEGNFRGKKLKRAD
jgi:hypothetical protein